MHSGWWMPGYISYTGERQTATLPWRFDNVSFEWWDPHLQPHYRNHATHPPESLVCGDTKVGDKWAVLFCPNKDQVHWASFFGQGALDPTK